MLISVSHSMAIMSLQNPYHSLEKIKKKTDRKMFPQTNYMEQDSTKNHLTLGENQPCFQIHAFFGKIILFLT